MTVGLGSLRAPVFAAHNICISCSHICGWHKNWEAKAFARNGEKVALCPPMLSCAAHVDAPTCWGMLGAAAPTEPGTFTVRGRTGLPLGQCFVIAFPWFVLLGFCISSIQHYRIVVSACFSGPAVWGSEYFQVTSVPKWVPLKTKQIKKALNKKIQAQEQPHCCVVPVHLFFCSD